MSDQVEPSRGVSDEVAEDMEFFGAQDEIADAPREEEVEPEFYEVWPDNWLAVCLFYRLRHRWEIGHAADGEVVRAGLRDSAIKFVLETTVGLPKRKWPEVIDDLEAMEDAALKVMKKARADRRLRRAEELKAAQGRAP